MTRPVLCEENTMKQLFHPADVKFETPSSACSAQRDIHTPISSGLTRLGLLPVHSGNWSSFTQRIGGQSENTDIIRVL